MNPTQILSKMVFHILLWVLVFIAGFGFGYAFHSTGALKADIKAINQTAQTTAQSVAQAQVDSQKLEVKTAATTAAVDQNKQAIHTRVVAQLHKPAVHPPQDPTTKDQNATSQSDSLACSGFALDTGTVRLLNASRAGAALRPAGSGDEASDASPALCFTDFIDADQDLTKLYLDLSARHDALVDSVEQFQQQQRDRLGIKAALEDGLSAGADDK